MKKITFEISVLISFAWSLYLVIGVILGADYALTRAAGGQFDAFPTYLRFLYLINAAVIIWQIDIFIKLIQGKKVKPVWPLKAFVIIGVLGTLANGASRSANERWNVIPLLITTFAFWQFDKKNNK